MKVLNSNNTTSEAHIKLINGVNTASKKMTKPSRSFKIISLENKTEQSTTPKS